jgi:hypothetical protein
MRPGASLFPTDWYGDSVCTCCRDVHTPTLQGTSFWGSPDAGVCIQVFKPNMGLFKAGHNTQRIVAGLALTWLPLAVLSILGGTAWGNKVKIPLLCDASIYGRFFVALPLLIAAELVIDPCLGLARHNLRRTDCGGLVVRVCRQSSPALSDDSLGLAICSLELLAAQGLWMNDGAFFGGTSEKDPVAGAGDGTGTFDLPRRPVRMRLKGLPRFVVTRGGEYCFLPGLRALRWLGDPKV